MGESSFVYSRRIHLMCRDKEITVKVRRIGAGQREVLLSDGHTISEEDTVNWVVRDPKGSVLDYGCDVMELIEQYGHMSETADAQRTT
jgi:hypothetical protein